MINEEIGPFGLIIQNHKPVCGLWSNSYAIIVPISMTMGDMYVSKMAIISFIWFFNIIL